MKMEDVTGGQMKIGSTIYEMVEAKFNGTVVWPLNIAYTYQIDQNSISFHYTDGYYMLRANGNNGVYFTGTVLKMNGSTVVETLTGVTLIPSLQPGSEYYLGDSYTVWGHNLETTERSQYNEQITLSYQNATANVTIYQQANVKSAYGDPVYGPAIVDSETVTGTSNYTLVFTADQYYSSSSKCPASGGTARFTLSGSHDEVYTEYWHRTVTQNYTYTATGSTLYPETNTQYGNTPGNSRQVTDTPTITKISGDSAIILSGLDVTIPSEGQVEYLSGRSATFRAINGGLSKDITIYQDINIKISTSTVYDIYVHIQSATDFPAVGGSFDVNYRSFKTVAEIWSSGSYPGTSEETYSRIDISPEGKGITTTTSAGASLSRVAGEGTFKLNIPGNTDGGQRTITVYLTSEESIGASDSDYKNQDYTILPTGIVYPTVNPGTGRVTLHFELSSGTPTYPITFTNLRLHHQPQGSSTDFTSMEITGISITSSPYTARLQNQHSIPTPYSGSESGICWFSADLAVGLDIRDTAQTFPHKNYTVGTGQLTQ